MRGFIFITAGSHESLAIATRKSAAGLVDAENTTWMRVVRAAMRAASHITFEAFEYAAASCRMLRPIFAYQRAHATFLLLSTTGHFRIWPLAQVAEFASIRAIFRAVRERHIAAART